MFEESESTIRDRILSRVPYEWRKEPGDFIYDAVTAPIMEFRNLQIQQDNILENAFAGSASGKWLDYKLYDIGLTREAATTNVRQLSITASIGVGIPKGHTLISIVRDSAGTPFEFTVNSAVSFSETGTLTVNVTSVLTGTQTNLPMGTDFILRPAIPGVQSITDLGTTIPAADTESDSDALARYVFKLKHPDTGGNKNDYVRWAQDIPGVGVAKCVPRWNGNGTVKVVLIGTEYTPAVTSVVNDVQTYIDPGSSGLGDGKAPCGATVTVIAAAGVNINISATIAWVQGADPATAKTAFTAAVTTYLKGLAFSEYPNVIYNKIAALLSFTDGISNFTNLTINGAATDITIGAETVAILGTVTFA